ncbi:MerR family transcriptional regulator [Comamonas sp. GB3 AK4-5]|uniref:MerR family transcriptional regulator n=1 Tax=Comamonas sp. GB3 AK4-5 TaxID=3231487 RepID=UPI00351DDF1A
MAQRTGLTVRTLHHYDEIGLLVPSHRSEAGYRMYNRDDLARLHQIQALKQLGFGLAQIGDTLAHNGVSLEQLIVQQIAALDQQVELAARLHAQLLRPKAVMDRGETPEMAEWTTQAQETTGGDPGLLIKLGSMTRNERATQQHSGIDSTCAKPASNPVASHKTRGTLRLQQGRSSAAA